MRFTVQHLPAEVARPLRAYRSRAMLYRYARVVLGTLVLWWALAVVVMHVDRFAFLDREVRAAMTWGAHAVAAAVGLTWLAVTWWRRPTTAQVAYALESNLTRRNDELFVTLDNVNRKSENTGIAAASVGLVEALIERSRRSGAQVRGASLAPRRPVAGWLIAVAGAAVVSGALWSAPGYQFPLMAERFVFPNRNLPKPSFVKIELVPNGVVPAQAPGGEPMVGMNQDVVLEARISGRMPTPIAWVMEQLGYSSSRCMLAIGDDDGDGDRPLTFAPGANATGTVGADPALPNAVISMGRARADLFVHIRRDVEQSFRYQVRCGDAQTAVRSVRMVVQPKVEDVALRITPPKYSQLDARPITDPRYPDADQPGQRAAVRLLPGTQAELVFASDQPDSTGSILIRHADGTRTNATPQWDPTEQHWRYRFVFEDEQADIRVAVINREGFESVEPYDFSLVRWEDARPVVKVDSNGESIEAVSGELVHLPFEATDDVGLAELVIEQVVGEGRTETTRAFAIDWSREEKGRVEARAALDLAEVDARPGERLRVRIRATDLAGNVGRSAELHVQVTSFTRGEDERQRIRHLRFIEQALRALADAPPTGERLTLGGDTRAAIRSLAEQHDITLDEGFGLDQVMALLELQQYAAPTIGDRDDLRKLYVQVLAACTGAASRTEARAQRLNALADTLGQLIRYRHTTNLLWRTFGLRYELRRIRGEMVDLVVHGDGDDAQASQRSDALARRVALFGRTLDETGAAWRGLTGTDRDAVTPIIDGFAGRMAAMTLDAARQRGEQGEAAFDAEAERLAGETTDEGRRAGEDEPITREDLFTTPGRDRAARAKRQALTRQWVDRVRRRQFIARYAARPANELDEALGTLLEHGRRPLPEALAERDAARQTLDADYQRMLDAAAAGVAGGDGRRRPADGPWLTADSRLLGWSPYAPMLPRFRAAATALGHPGDASGPPKALRALYEPPRGIAQAVAIERRALAALEFDWRVTQLRQQRQLGDHERFLAYLLMLVADGAPAGMLADEERAELTRLIATGAPTDLHRAAMKRWFAHRFSVDEIPDFMAFCRDIASLQDRERSEPLFGPIATVRRVVQSIHEPGPNAEQHTDLRLGDPYTALMNLDRPLNPREKPGPTVLSRVLEAGEATAEQKQRIVDGLNAALHDTRLYGRLSPEQEAALDLPPAITEIGERAKRDGGLLNVGLGGVSEAELVRYNRAVIQAVLADRLHEPAMPPAPLAELKQMPNAIAAQAGFIDALDLPTARSYLPTLLAEAEDLDATLGRLTADPSGIDSTALADQATQTLATADRLDVVLRLLALELATPDDHEAPDDTTDDDAARLLLQLRRERSTYLERLNDPVATIRRLADTDLDPGTLTILASAARELGQRHAQFVDALRRAIDPTAATPDAPAPADAEPPARTERFALLDEFRFARQCRATAAQLPSLTPERAQAFGEDWPRLAMVRLLREAPGLRWVREQLQRAEALLRQRRHDLLEVPQPGPHNGTQYRHPYGDGYNALLRQTGHFVRQMRLNAKAAGDGPFHRRVLRALDHIHNRLNNIHTGNELDVTVYYNPNIIKPRKDEDGHWFTEQWYLDGRLSILDRDQSILREAMQTMRNARRATTSGWPRFAGSPRVPTERQHLVAQRSAALRDQAEHALAAFAESLDDAMFARPLPALETRRVQAWLAWYERLLYTPLSGSGALETTREAQDDDTDPNLKFLREEVEKAGRVKTLRNYRDETYQYLQRAGEKLE